MAGNRQPWPQAKDVGRAIEKPKEKGKGKGKSGGNAKGKDKGLKCNVCGGIGHPARMCPSEGWLDDLEQDMPEGEDTDEEGTTRQSNWGYLGSESCLMSSPPGLRDAFSEAGWTVVIRKSRNRQQCSKRCSDKRDTVLGSLWDDDNVILGQVADDRTRKGMVKISAGVDSGAEANALPENMMQWIPLKEITTRRCRSQISVESATCGGQLTQWMCRVFRGWAACAGTAVTTMGPVPVRPLLAPVDEESAPMGWRGRRGWVNAGGGRGREETHVQEEREPALEPGSAGAHEDSHLLPLLVRSCVRGGGEMIPTGQEEEGKDQVIIHTSQLIADSSMNNPDDSADQGSNPILI